MKKRFFANPNTRNQVIFTPFGLIHFVNHICATDNPEVINYLLTYPECFEIDGERYKQNASYFANVEYLKANIQLIKLQPVEETQCEEPEEQVEEKEAAKEEVKKSRKKDK